MQTDGNGASSDLRDRSPSSEIIGQFMALAREIGHLKGSQEHHTIQANQRLGALEQWRSEIERWKLAIHSATPSTTSTMPSNGHGLLSGITHPRRRWRTLWILFEKAASVGPTALQILWWLVSRSAGAWLMLRGNMTSVWQALEQLWNHMTQIFWAIF